MLSLIACVCMCVRVCMYAESCRRDVLCRAVYEEWYFSKGAALRERQTEKKQREHKKKVGVL